MPLTKVSINKVTLTTRTTPAFPTVDPPASVTDHSYSKVATNGLNEMFFESTTPGSSITQLTNLATPVVVANGGSTFLPGGLILKWGNVTGSTGGTPFTFAAVCGNAFPNNCYSMTLGNSNTTGTTTATFSNLSKTGGTISSSNVNQVYFIAIGN